MFLPNFVLSHVTLVSLWCPSYTRHVNFELLTNINLISQEIIKHNTILSDNLSQKPQFHQIYVVCTLKMPTINYYVSMAGHQNLKLSSEEISSIQEA